MRYVIIASSETENWKEIGTCLDKKGAEEKISSELEENNRCGYACKLRVAKIVRRVEKNKSYFILANHGDGWFPIHMDTAPYKDTYQWPYLEAQKMREEFGDFDGAFMIAESVHFDIKVKIGK